MDINVKNKLHNTKVLKKINYIYTNSEVGFGLVINSSGYLKYLRAFAHYI